MAANDSEDDRFSILSLTKEEMKILPWKQLLTNGALNGTRVVIDNSTADVTGQDICREEEYFSDGELSDDEEQQAEHGTPSLELRSYQTELAADALTGKNTLICAPTGSGKTRVATYLILEHLRASDSRERKVAFLARTVPLATQQYKSMCKYLPQYEITLITGDSGENLSLHMLLPYSDIFVMTPMILENHITRGLLPNLGVFSLIVFDECHHTRKGEPYNTLMNYYLQSKNQILTARRQGRILDIKLPQIVGLTASIGVEKAESLEEATSNILKVCGNLDVSKVSTVEIHKDELRKIVPVPTELSVRLSVREDDVAVYKIIKIMQELESHMVHHVRQLNIPELNRQAVGRPNDRKSQEYEQWTVLTMQAAKAVPLSTTNRERDMCVRLIVIIARYLLGYRFALETYDLVELKDVMDYLDKTFQDLRARECLTTEENSFYEYFTQLKSFVLEQHGEENHNLKVLTDVLMNYLVNKDKTGRAIIFVRTRALTEALASWLNRCEIEELRQLNACAFTGSNSSEDGRGTSQARQENILKQFRAGSIKLLVATSVAEEGIDVPECNLVVKYNNVGNEVSTVQTRGRSRAFGGVSLLLGMANVLEKEYRNKERAKLMSQAIESIKSMEPAAFEAVVREHQQNLLEAAMIAEQRQLALRQNYQNVPFRIVCPLCRKVSIEGTNMRTIYEKYRVSIDRNLLNQIMVRPYGTPEPMDGLLFVGQVFCKGETRPGKRCYHQLGVIIKHKGVPIVSVGIKNIAFDLGNNAELKQWKQWKKVNLVIDELTYDDFIRYINENVAMTASHQYVTNDVETDTDSTDEDNDI